MINYIKAYRQTLQLRAIIDNFAKKLLLEVDKLLFIFLLALVTFKVFTIVNSKSNIFKKKNLFAFAVYCKDKVTVLENYPFQDLAFLFG